MRKNSGGTIGIYIPLERSRSHPADRYSLWGRCFYDMKATLFLSALLISAALPISAQTLHDPQDPNKRGEVDAARSTAGVRATRDQYGTYQMKDGILKAQGAIQFMKDGKMNKVNKELKLSEGFVVRPNGQITKPDGSTVTLEEGQMLTLDGRLVQAPPSTGTTQTGGTDKPLERTGNLTDFGQSGVTGPGGQVREEQKK